ncbi:Jacalin-like lectin domain [Phytophthora infestans]|uniref:Jacalin-like lectin domain n=1 Tax=Phytophthora infestans TaxID=4787 RepID=A0A8S9URL3_PHYIN|nr:Jacalin-like lectin domain [Phytophthora infestans]
MNATSCHFSKLSVASMITRAWVVVLFQTLVCLTLVALPGAFSADESVQLSEAFGGPHGNEFSDQASVAAGQSIGSITIRAGERVDGISLEVTAPKAATFSHGGSGGKANTLTLAKEEYITSMEAHWGEKKGRTRIFYLSFGTSAGNTVAAGSQTESKNTVTAPKGFQLGGFFGQDGNEIDKLGAIWTRISAEAPAPAPTSVPPAPAPAPVSAAASGSGEPVTPANSALASAAGSGSAEAPTKQVAATSTEDSALGSDVASGSGGAPIKKKKKKAIAIASSDGSADAELASADASGSSDAPIKEKKAAAPSEDSDAASTLTDASGSAEPPINKKKTAVASDEGSALESGEDSTRASGDASGSSGTPIKKKKKATAVASSDGSVDPELASAEASGSAETPTKKKKAAASSKDSGGGSAEDAASTLTDTSGSAEPPTKKEKTAVASDDGSAIGSTEDSALASDDASGSAEAVTNKKPAVTSSDGSVADSAATSLEASLAASSEGSADKPTQSSAVDSTAGSGPGSDKGSAAEAPAGSGVAQVAPPAGTEAPGMSVKDSIVLSESFGGPHGRDFSDKNYVNSGQTVSQVSIYAGKRLDGISLDISAPKTQTFTHGGTGGDRKVLKLGDKEYITSMEVHWGKKDDHTRIFYVNFVTSAGNSLSGGSMTDDKSTVTAPKGFQLAGFFGKDGKEIDTLGAVWASIDLVTPAPTPAPAPVTIEDSPGTVAPEDIAGSLSEVHTKANKRPVQLSDSFGGPHGEQFSDQLACTSGMVISSVTIRAGERLDGLTVQVAAPKEMTFTHGGTGGKENTLTLERGEYITTMDVHWGQKSGHTRIFYMNLVTNKGNKVSGGSETKEKGSVTAPRGYQLAGFFGRYGDEMDLIGAVWSSIAAVNETSSTVKVSAEGDIALGELFGGPHGNAFSRISTRSSLDKRSARSRSDRTSEWMP